MNWLIDRPPQPGDIRERWVFPIIPLKIPVYDGGFNRDFRPDRIKVVWLEWVKISEQADMGATHDPLFWTILCEASK